MNTEARLRSSDPGQCPPYRQVSIGHPQVQVSEADGVLRMQFGPMPENAGTLQHWNYDTYRVKLGDGRYGWSLVSFGMARPPSSERPPERRFCFTSSVRLMGGEHYSFMSALFEGV